MKKLFRYSICILLLFLFTACNMSMEDLLVAPSLTADQSGILEAIQQSHTERTSLKYPVSGDWRNPIHFLEQTVPEGLAIVFYSVSPEVNARIALVSKESDSWTVVSELQGDGPEVNSVQILQGSGINLLVEWGSVNPVNRRLTVYNISLDELSVGFREECSDIIMKDFNQDEILDFLYVTAEKANEPFKLVYVSGSDNDYVVASEVELHHEMEALLKLQYEEDSEKNQYIYIDENIIGNRVSTEVFKLGDGSLSRIELEQDFDTYQLFIRQVSLPSRSFYNINDSQMTIPSDTAPRETIADEALWKYWYYLKDNTLGYSFASYVNIPLNLNIALPNSWLDSVVVVEDELDQRLFRFYREETLETLFEFKVLRVEESISMYLDQGFSTIGSSIGGIYRYMYKAHEGCSLADLIYITNHLYSVTN